MPGRHVISNAGRSRLFVLLEFELGQEGERDDIAARMPIPRWSSTCAEATMDASCTHRESES